MRTIFAGLLAGLLVGVASAQHPTKTDLGALFDEPAYTASHAPDWITPLQMWYDKSISQLHKDWSITMTKIDKRLPNGWYFETASLPSIGNKHCEVHFLVQKNGVVYRAAARESTSRFGPGATCRGLRSLNASYLERELLRDVRRAVKYSGVEATDQ